MAECICRSGETDDFGNNVHANYCPLAVSLCGSDHRPVTVFCRDCGGEDGEHTETCSAYVEKRAVPQAESVFVQSDNFNLSKGGVKYDKGKPRLDLLAPEFVCGIGEVLSYGAAKYRDRNWEKGMRWGRCVAALLRHIFAWMRGEDIDPESGLHHLDHAGCCLMLLRAYIARKVGEDDRKREFGE